MVVVHAHDKVIVVIKEAGIVTKRSNDEGIDGIIKEDKIGFEMIYI